MATINGLEKPNDVSSQSVDVDSEEVKPSQTLSAGSYDVDTPFIKTDAGGFKLRISGVDGTEIGKGADAEYFRDGLFGIFGELPVEVESKGKGTFGRTLGSFDVEGMDWRMIAYEAGMSENWGKYGFDAVGSEADERYKWYAGKTQSTNVEAYELLESGVEPSEIISDEDYQRIELLRRSFKTHIADGAEGVLDKEDALRTARELFKDNELLTKAQKRKWYESARRSNVAETMLAAWRDPYTQASIRRQPRERTLDVNPSADTSLWGILKNTVNQQFQGHMEHDISTKMSMFAGKDLTDNDLALYIQKNDIKPDVAAKMYDAYEKEGYFGATDLASTEVISRETESIRAAIDKKSGANYIGNMLFHEAMPYLVDPTSWVAGKGAADIAAKITYSKVASPLIQKMLQYGTTGSATALAESFVFTANNYRDFTNEELVKTWATDAGFGGAFGAVFASVATGVRAYGQRAKGRSLGEGIEDISYKPFGEQPAGAPEDTIATQEAEAWRVREEEAAAFQEHADNAYKEFVEGARTRMDAMQNEVATQAQTGNVDTPIFEVDVEDVALTPRPEPTVDEPAIDSTTPQVDSRTPEQIEADELAWQQTNIDAALAHQDTIVRPAIEQIHKAHNVIAKVHRWLGKSVGMQEFATKLVLSADAKMSYLGTHILESGAGFTGKMKRKASAALIKDSIYTRTVGLLNNSYVDNISAWAMKQGTGKYKAFKAAWEGGKVNDTARAFHRAVMERQEARHMGYSVEPDEHLDNYLRELDRTNDELFEGRIKANIKGFDANRRIKHYMPHVWKKVKVGEITKKYGERAVLDLLVESIESAKRAGKIADNTSTSELAERQLNWINGLGDSMEHTGDIGAGVSGRSKSRIPLDFTVSKNGLHMLDLVDTDIPTLMDSYTQRAGADIGISEATNGLIRSEGDFEKFLTPNSDADKLLVQDAKDLLYGRPTRGGMSPEMRSMMDLVTVQQMGGIGVAQLAETGTMAQRMVVNYVSQPKIAKKIWAMAGESMDDKGVLHQVRSISAVNDSMEYINRYSVNNIDQAQIDEISDFKAASIDAVDKATLGAYKAQFGRMLGSLSGVNAIQKAQSRLLQASFSVDLARAAKFNKGTSTVERLADLGITSDGKAFESIRKHVEFDSDGFPTDFNFDKWDDDALKEFMYAMNREEAQLMPRVMSGELPVFMNKPLWQAIMQFRKTPLAFMSKGAQRNLQFADREAVLGTVLNAMTAGITRYAKVAAAGGAYAALSDEEFRQPTMDQMQPYNYVSNFGILGDSYTLFQSWSKVAQEKDGIEALWEGAKQVPTISGLDSAYHAIQGDPSAIKSITPLNTLQLVNEVSNAVIRNMEHN